MIIEPIINSYKIKYNILKKLVSEAKMKGSKLNIYINLDSIISKFYRDAIIEGIRDFKDYDPIILSSELINVIAHYRHFFWKYYKVSTTFYMYILNSPVKKLPSSLENYMIDKLDKISNDNDRYGSLNKFISENLRLMIITTMYLQQCYLIPNNGLDPSLATYHFINKNAENDEVANLILSTDKFDYQLLNMPNTYILNLKYDDSKILNSDNIYDHYFSKVKTTPKNKISPELYSLIISLIGIKGRSVKPIVKGLGFGTAIKKLDKIISNGLMFNSYSKNMNSIAYALDIPELTSELRDRFHVLDLESAYNKLTKSKIEDIIEKNIVDRYDNASLMNINSTYYKNNPIKLIELCEGVDFNANSFEYERM